MSFSAYLAAVPRVPYPRKDARELEAGALYLRLFHGRHHPDENLDDWGFDGPYVGPIELGWTYGTLRLHNPDCTDTEDVPMQHDLVAFDGAFYGDMDFLRGSTLMRKHERAPDPGIALLTFEQFKSLLRKP